MRALLIVAVAVVALVAQAPAYAAIGDELLLNPGLELADGAKPLGWSSDAWGVNSAQFTYPSTGAHSGTRSVRVDMSSYTSGDGKWMPDPIAVQGGRYYVFSDWYRSDANSAVSVYYERAGDPEGGGTWANLFSGIAPAPTWTSYRTGFTMPADAVRAVFAHFIARPGFLQTDDYSVTEQAAPAGFTTPMVSLTFDNSSKAFYERVRPLLDAKGFTTTQYVPTYGMTTKRADPVLMTASELRALAAAGHEIGSHSVTHPDLTAIDDAQLAYEVQASKSFLESILGGSITGFAYPFGSYDWRVIGAVRGAGYTMARSVEDGYNSRLNLEPYDVRVQNMLNTTTTAEVRGWIAYAAAHSYWLVIVYHEVVPDSAPLCAAAPRANPCLGPYDTTVSRFQAQLDALADAGLGSVVMPAGRAFAIAQAQVHGPVVGALDVAPRDPATNAVLTATPSGFSDPDGDPLAYHYQWSVNGLAVAGATLPTFDLGAAGNGDRGDTVSAEVRATDPYGNESTPLSAAVTVANSAPSAGSVRIAPTAPAAGESLTASPRGFSDADGDVLTYAYRWLRNGSLLTGHTDARLPSHGRAGDVIRVEVRAVDGSGGVSAPAAASVGLRRAGTDRTPPKIRISSPRPRRYSRARRLSIRFSCSDASGIKSCLGTVRRHGGWSQRVRSGRQIRLQRTGRYQLRVTARDRAGNRSSRSVRFTVVRG